MITISYQKEPEPDIKIYRNEEKISGYIKVRLSPGLKMLMKMKMVMAMYGMNGMLLLEIL